MAAYLTAIWQKTLNLRHWQSLFGGLGLFNIEKREELKVRQARLSELNEEIEVLLFQETPAMHVVEKNDTAGMKQVVTDLASAEKDLIGLGKEEATLTDAISRGADTFQTLNEQANALDLLELIDAHLSFVSRWKPGPMCVSGEP